MAAPTDTSTKTTVVTTLKQRRFGLPVWVWVIILLGLLVLVASWRRNRKGGGVEMETTGDDTSQVYRGPVINVDAPPPPDVNVVVNVPKPPKPTTGPATPPAGGGTSPTTPPTPTPTPPGKMISVTTYTASNPPWNSTIWGIWNHYRSQNGLTNWQALWNHPQNAALRKLRGVPEHIRPGDKVFVPGVR